MRSRTTIFHTDGFRLRRSLANLSGMSASRQGPTLTVRGVVLGQGRPKVIVPLTDAHEAGLIAAARRIAASPVDMVEWRVDRFDGRGNRERVRRVAARLRETIGDRPLLFTPRTQDEGGEWAPSPDAYRDVVADACAGGDIDLVDVQYLHPAARRCIETAHAHHVPVIASSHDFQATPALPAIMDQLEAMQSAGADVCKIAVMPHKPEDVATLLAATARAHETARVPLLTMSMGALGGISRLAGQVFGSCATFATLGDEGSAPGQMPLDEVLASLDLIGRGLA
ncbi:type I 3-dehydroquinate dehydratase [Brooklawnia cerclae]